MADLLCSISNIHVPSDFSFLTIFFFIPVCTPDILLPIASVYVLGNSVHMWVSYLILYVLPTQLVLHGGQYFVSMYIRTL